MTDVPVTTPSSSSEPHRLQRGVLTVPNGIALAAAAIGITHYAFYRAKSPRKIAALGNFLAEEDLPPDEQPDALLVARTPAVQHLTFAEEVTRHPEFRDGGPR